MTKTWTMNPDEVVVVEAVDTRATIVARAVLNTSEYKIIFVIRLIGLNGLFTIT